LLALGAGCGVNLSPRFPADSPLYVEVVDETRQIIQGAQFGEEGMEIGFGNTVGFVQRPTADGSVALEITRRAASITHPTLGKLEFDSAADGDHGDKSLADMNRPWVGKSLVVSKGPDQLSTEIDGFDELQAAMEESAAGDMIYEQTKSNYTADTLRRTLFDNRFVPLPPASVTVGQSWSRSFETKFPRLGRVTFQYDCTLDKIENPEGTRLAVIKYRAKGVFSGEPAAESATGQRPVLRSMDTDGTIMFDLELGQPIAQDAQFTTVVNLVGPGENAEPTNTVTAKSAVHVTAVPLTEHVARHARETSD